MKDNIIIKDIFFSTDEKFLEEYYIIKTNDTFISEVVSEINSINDMISDFDISKCNDLKEKLKKKISGKTVMSYSYFSKWLNTINLTLSLVDYMPDNELVELIELYNQDDRKDLNPDLTEFLAVALSHSKSSQSKGHTFKQKLIEQFERNGYLKVENESELGKNSFTLNDATIMSYIKNKNIDFEWSVNHDGKKPDFIFIDNEENIFIGEHKNIKESGGAQDKQINEIISFISYDESEKNVYYVSYCDGPYFNNSLSAIISGPNKKATQLKNIESNIQSTKNYFVNTSAFEELIKR